MNLAFTGDLVLQEVEKKSDFVFFEINKLIREEDLKLCVNLESPFTVNGMRKIKNKISLSAKSENVKYLKYLNPYLVNLSNNHINDFGNKSVELTFEILNREELDFFGVGLKNNNRNIKIDKNSKILLLAFSERSSDQTGSRLFAENEFLGPYPISYEMIKNLREEFKDYFIIVNIHWGLEDIYFPEPSKRSSAYNVIDSGADLIIGHHPHIIQPIECYKGRYIFYSLGNFYFPDISYFENGIKHFKRAKRHQKKGLIPILKIEKGKKFSLKIKIVQLSKDGNLVIKNFRRLNFLLPNNFFYRWSHQKYLYFLRITWILRNIVKNPMIIILRIKKSLMWLVK